MAHTSNNSILEYIADETSSKSCPKRHLCPTCSKSFGLHHNLIRHQKSKHNDIIHPCTKCKKTFSRKDALKRHLKGHKDRLKSLLNKDKLPRYQRGEGLAKRYESINPSTVKSCLGTFFTYTTTPNQTIAKDLEAFLKVARGEIIDKIEEATAQHYGVKWYIIINVHMSRKVSQTEEETCSPFFRSKCMISYSGDSNEQTDNNVEDAIAKVLQSYEEFQGKGSGWIFDHVINLEIKVSVFKPLQ